MLHTPPFSIDTEEIVHKELPISEKEALEYLKFNFEPEIERYGVGTYLEEVKKRFPNVHEQILNVPQMGLLDPDIGYPISALTDDQKARIIIEQIARVSIACDLVLGKIALEGRLKNWELPIYFTERSFFEHVPTYLKAIEAGVPLGGNIALFGSLTPDTSQAFIRFVELYLGDHLPVIIDPEGVLSYVDGVSMEGTLQESNLKPNRLPLGLTNYLLKGCENKQEEIPIMLTEIERILRPDGGIFVFIESSKDAKLITANKPPGLKLLARVPTRVISTRNMSDHFYKTGELDEKDVVEYTDASVVVLRKNTS